MPRTSRNTVEFESDGIKLKAEFKHQHAEEHDHREALPVYKDAVKEVELIELVGGTLGSGREVRKNVLMVERILVRNDWEYAVKTPITEEVEIDGRRAERKLRHITTCLLYTSADGIEWKNPIGQGTSRCSVKDKYNWRFGIKESLVDAIKSAGIENSGPVLGAFYTELPKRPKQVEADDDEIIVIG